MDLTGRQTDRLTGCSLTLVSFLFFVFVTELAPAWAAVPRSRERFRMGGPGAWQIPKDTQWDPREDGTLQRFLRATHAPTQIRHGQGPYENEQRQEAS